MLCFELFIILTTQNYVQVEFNKYAINTFRKLNICTRKQVTQFVPIFLQALDFKFIEGNNQNVNSQPLKQYQFSTMIEMILYSDNETSILFTCVYLNLRSCCEKVQMRKIKMP